ncbi:MAG: pyridoxamine 5'-phosphate oxidase family protein [Pararobbsia sp.]
MNIGLDEPLQLLHTARFGTLATRSRDDGCPYPTVLPFAPDARHRPVLLVSRLAEHTRNLQADAHAGFLVFEGCTADVLAGPRTTLTGRAVPSECATGGAGSPARRYLRYHPDAERYLQLGDFTFFTLVPAKLRHIGGFGAMGWLDAHELNPIAPLDDAEEAALLDDIAPALPAGIRLLGIDRYGVDFERDRVRARQTFAPARPDEASGEAFAPASIKTALETAIAAITSNSSPMR